METRIIYPIKGSIPFSKAIEILLNSRLFLKDAGLEEKLGNQEGNRSGIGDLLYNAFGCDEQRDYDSSLGQFTGKVKFPNGSYIDHKSFIRLGTEERDGLFEKMIKNNAQFQWGSDDSYQDVFGVVLNSFEGPDTSTTLRIGDKTNQKFFRYYEIFMKHKKFPTEFNFECVLNYDNLSTYNKYFNKLKRVISSHIETNLETPMKIAIKSENYEMAAKIRDQKK